MPAGPSPDRARVAIIGGTGYTASELVRILAVHPRVEIAAIVSKSRAGERFSEVHPAFRDIEDRPMVEMKALDEIEFDLAFLALPHRVSMEYVRDHGVDAHRIIDLSGDFRLQSADVYEEWYQTTHVAPEKLESVAFGLPELYREQIREARLVANPGCYPTSAILALAPLLRRGLVEPRGPVVDSKSGVTGAGARPSAMTHFPEVVGSFKAYGLLRHRHTPEIEQALSFVAGRQVEVLFTPHLLPIDRGILTTAYAVPTDGFDAGKLQDIYAEDYADEPFVRLVENPPSLKHVRGSNYCDVFPTYDARTNRVVVISVLDNLVKGAAGQAVQNLNLVFGWPETTGLTQGPLSP